MLDQGALGVDAPGGPRSPWPLSVLVIEDDQMQATLVRRWLEATQQFAVTIAADGRHGHDLLMSKQWDLVVSDLRLPHIDGFELLSSFRLRNRETPVLLMSGYARFDDVQKAVRLEAGDLLVKPLERSTFVNRARSLVQVPSRRSGVVREEAHGLLTSAVSAVITGVAQQLENKLTSPFGYADLLKIELARPKPDLESCRELIRGITGGADALAQSLQSLRRLVRQPATSAAPTDLGELVRDVCDTVCVYGEGFEAPVAVEVGADLLVASDPIQLRLVIAALLFSAAEIGGAEPALSVRVYQDRSRALVEVFTRCAGDGSLDAFAVTKWLPFGRWAPGAIMPTVGLDPGITVSMDVRADGLAFQVVAGRLPDPASPAAIQADAPRAEPMDRRILLFDTHRGSAEITAGILRAESVGEVDVAHTSNDAWRLLDARRYDLVLIDLCEEEDSGRTFLSGLRSVAPRLAQSAIVIADEPALAEKAGASQFVSASSTNEHFLRAVRNGMALQGGRSEPVI